MSNSSTRSSFTLHLFSLADRTPLHRGYGATVARLTPDQKVGSSNLSALICFCTALLRRVAGEAGGAEPRRRNAETKGKARQVLKDVWETLWVLEASSQVGERTRLSLQIGRLKFLGAGARNGEQREIGRESIAKPIWNSDHK